MRAARFDAFGGFDNLKVVEVDRPRADAKTAVVRVEASSINPSDVKNIGGAMRQTRPPRIPGRDYAGVVVEAPPEWLGAEVWGTGGDVGFTRDGTHAQYLAAPVASLRRKPATLSFDQAASVGVNFLAAWGGLVEAAKLKAGETLLLIGSGGGVGGAASQIAKQIGARVIGADRREPGPDAPIRQIAEHSIIGASDLPEALAEVTGGALADVVFDLVGGAMFRPALACLTPGGRLVEISAGGQREVSFDLADFYHNESRLFGVDTLKHDLTASAKTLDLLAPGFEAGAYRASPIAATIPLDQIRDGYRRVAEGARGRIVLKPNA